MAMILAVISFMILSSAMGGCWYVKLPTGSLTPTPPFFYATTGTSNGVGLASFQYRDASEYGGYLCYEYSDTMQQNFLDASWFSGIAFGYMSLIFSGVTMLVLFAIGCVSFSSTAISLLGMMSLAASISALLTLSFFASFITKPPYNATFWWGSGLSVAGFVVSLITAGVILTLPPSKNTLDGQDLGPPPQAYTPGTQTTTETVLPDGTKKIVKTTVNPDGSQTVEETVIQPVG